MACLVGGYILAAPKIRFNDGASYEEMMGVWSRMVGEIFIDWLAPKPGLVWADIGCGNGAFSETLIERCAPAELQGIDPSEEQLEFARSRPAARLAVFRQGDAMALPYSDNEFDAAVMALVLFFVPKPALGVAEMMRAVKPGGTVSAYVWDSLEGGGPADSFSAELRGMGFSLMKPPSVESSRMDALRALWAGAGLEAIETRVITVERSFPNFEDFWTTTIKHPILWSVIASLAPDDVEELRTRMRTRLPADGAGRISYAAWANAIKGHKPSGV